MQERKTCRCQDCTLIRARGGAPEASRVDHSASSNPSDVKAAQPVDTKHLRTHAAFFSSWVNAHRRIVQEEGGGLEASKEKRVSDRFAVKV